MRSATQDWRLIVVGAFVISILTVAGPAWAGLLPTQDEAELVQFLAQARAEQNVCYGYVVTISGTTSSVQTGSDRGVGVSPDSGCDDSVVLDARINYTSETSESNDSATVSIMSTIRGIDASSLPISSADLLGDRDDEALRAAVEALPGLVAAASTQVPFQPVVVRTGPPPDDDQLAVSAGSDAARRRGGLVVTLGLLGLASLGYGVFSVVAQRNTAGSARRGLMAAGGPSISVGDVVTVQGWDATVRGQITYSEDGEVWWDHHLSDGSASRWLTVVPGSDWPLLLSDKIPLGLVSQGQPHAAQVMMQDGTVLHRVETGRARYAASGSTGTGTHGTVVYSDYRQQGGQRSMSFEEFDGALELSLGTPIPASALIVHGNPASTTQE
ncbi:MAG: DUF4178 domain-containing protein [Euzebya sp.]